MRTVLDKTEKVLYEEEIGKRTFFFLSMRLSFSLSLSSFTVLPKIWMCLCGFSDEESTNELTNQVLCISIHYCTSTKSNELLIN